jgi:TRAP-type mannitol/chloroaromatic compound transport system permease small subunit
LRRINKGTNKYQAITKVVPQIPWLPLRVNLPLTLGSRRHSLFKLHLENHLSTLLKFALGMDWLSERFGRVASWAVLLSAGICALNAFIRYGLDWSSNGMLEIQWYMFAWVVMVGSPYVLKVNEHVRVDLIYGKLKGNAPVYVDIFGLIVFLLPIIGYLTWLSFPYFLNTLVSGEMSQNAGGLIRWPATLALPVGFAMLWLQGVAELVKRIAYLQGKYTMDTHYEKPLQ